MTHDHSSARLTRVETADGLLLDGAIWPCGGPGDGLLDATLGGDARGGGTLRADVRGGAAAFLLVHGTGGNFHHPGVLETFARQASASMGEVWRVNTRGHDGIVSIPGRRGSRPGGATYESLAESPLDLDAWTAAIHERTGRRVVLVGHSMGAVKSIAYVARYKPASVAALVAISPPRFCHQVWMSHPRAEAFRRSWDEASRLVAEGRGDAFLPVTQPVPFVATAAGFLAKYGPADEFDVARLLPEVSVPALVMIGTQSAATSPAFDGLVETLRAACAGNAGITIETVEGANTGYAGCETAPFERAAAWLIA